MSQAWNDLHGREVVAAPPNPPSTRWQPPSLPAHVAARLQVPSDEWARLAHLPAPTRAEVSMAVQTFRAGMEPAGEDDVSAALLALSVVWPNAKLSPAAAAAKVRLYTQALADLPSDLLALAVERATKTHDFQPKPAELRRLVEPELTRRRARLHRALLLERGLA
jgi:hypothetical protein